jgi:hypothetical protein
MTPLAFVFDVKPKASDAVNNIDIIVMTIFSVPNPVDVD